MLILLLNSHQLKTSQLGVSTPFSGKQLTVILAVRLLQMSNLELLLYCSPFLSYSIWKNLKSIK